MPLDGEMIAVEVAADGGEEAVKRAKRHPLAKPGAPVDRLSEEPLANRRLRDA